MLLNVFTLPNFPVLCPPFYRHGPCVYTDRDNIPALFRTTIYPLGPYTYWGFHFNVNAVRRLGGSRGGTLVEVWMLKSTSCLPSWERR